MPITASAMTSRQRLWATAKGQPTDRVPIFVWLNAHAGARLMAEFWPARQPRWDLAARFCWARFKNNGEMNASEIWRMLPLAFDIHTFNWANFYAGRLGSDLIQVAHATPWDYAAYGYHHGRLTITDLFGVRRAIGGIYPEMVRPIIQTLDDLKAYQPPPWDKDRQYNSIRRARRAFPNSSIAVEIWGPQDFTATSMFGMERFMTWLFDYPAEMHAFLDRWTDYWVNVIKKSAAAGADVMAIYDDYGYDHRPLISPAMWQEFTLPRLRRLVNAAHDAGALAMLHSCGYQVPFLDHYVALGIDLLQSLQPKAGNDFQDIYSKYGDRLTLITGIDVQRGESMTPSDLRAEILSSYHLAGRSGHHVLGFTHEMQYTMPAPNIRVIFQTINEIINGEHDR